MTVLTELAGLGISPAIHPNGSIAPGVPGTIYLTGTTTPVSVYPINDPLSTPNTTGNFVTDSYGRIPGWVQIGLTVDITILPSPAITTTIGGPAGPAGPTGPAGPPTGWFIPESYGAIGNGTSDDTLALNACIAAAEAYGTGASVLLSKPSYAHAGPLAVLTSGGIRIMGTGSRLQWTNGPTLKFTGGQGTGALTTLAAAITSTSATTITTNAAAPAYLGTGNFPILIDSEELWVYSGANTTTWTVRRGFNNTTAATHLINANVNPAYGAMLVGSPFGFTLENLRVQYTNAAFTGNLIDFDWYPPNFSDPTNWEIIGCAFRGGAGIASARSLIRLNHTIIGRIEACHFGERNGPGILFGDGNYCVAVQIRDSTWNSGAAGTYCVQTSSGAEAILIEGNTFEAVAGTYAGAWQHVSGATAWHVTFRDNWMGDQSNATYPWIDIVGQLNSFEISSNRFTAVSTGDVMVNFEASATPQGGLITGNHFDNGNIAFGGGSIRDINFIGNYLIHSVTGGGASIDTAVTNAAVGFATSGANPSVTVGQRTGAYTLDINEQSGNPSTGAKGIRLLSGSLNFGGSSGNADATSKLAPYNLIGMYLSSTPGALALPASGSTPTSGNLNTGDTSRFSGMARPCPRDQISSATT